MIRPSPFWLAAAAAWCMLLLVWIPGYLAARRKPRAPRRTDNRALQFAATALLLIAFAIWARLKLGRKLDWLGTLRGNLGFAVNQWLIYATGGLAYGHASISGSATATNGATVAALVPLAAWSNSDTRVGWALGAGLEDASDAHWRWKIEYLHVDLGTMTTTFGTNAGSCGGSGGFGASIPALAGTGSIKSKITDDIVRFGVNYAL